jgi:hypothetical protein
MGSIETLVLGVAILLVTAGTFWYCLPRGGKTHRFIGTALEPYVSVAVCAGVALSLSMILSSILTLRE